MSDESLVFQGFQPNDFLKYLELSLVLSSRASSIDLEKSTKGQFATEQIAMSLMFTKVIFCIVPNRAAHFFAVEVAAVLAGQTKFKFVVISRMNGVLFDRPTVLFGASICF
jgi:hypothetical protein